MTNNNITVKLPTGAKAPLQPFSAGKKAGHALLNPDNGKWNGFGITSDAMAHHLPEFVEIDGERVDLVSDSSKAGNPRRKAPHNTTLADGRRVVCRIVDLQVDNTWHYTIEVLPAREATKFGPKKTRTSVFS